ncbi:MAG: hypothetical protein K0R54_35 [Clostridiaceae bacterium]|jgi:inner membrane protein|nr:hypothetical protein [Clostridiaceae bacterium]
MNYKTHVLGGISSGLITTQIVFNSTELISKENYIFISSVIIASSIIGSLLPDIDHMKSYIGRRFIILSFLINKIFGHRGITHYFIPCIIFICCLFFINPLLDEAIQPIAFYSTIGLAIGIFSHLLLDYLNKFGIRNGGIIESIVSIVIIVGTVMILYPNNFNKIIEIAYKVKNIFVS